MNENTIGRSAKLIDAVRAIEATAKRLAVVVADDNQVVGTLTDGDIRRSILLGRSLQTPVSDAMTSNPVTASVNASDSALREMLKRHNIRSLPLVDAQNHYMRTLHERELVPAADGSVREKTFAAAIVMAGGEGRRLRPLTQNLPKPMVEVNGFSLLERQIRRLSSMGVTVIYISVNYLSDVIEDYFWRR